jgi:hypothetical protein
VRVGVEDTLKYSKMQVYMDVVLQITKTCLVDQPSEIK